MSASEMNADGASRDTVYGVLNFMSPKSLVFCRNRLRRNLAIFQVSAFGLFLSVTQAAPLMEEGFNYSLGSALATNPPWAGGAGPSVSMGSGSLTLTNLRATVPPGNLLQISGGTSLAVYRNFTGTPVTNGVVYLAALIRCVQAPTNNQFIAGLLSSGSTSHNSDSDALDLGVTAVTNGNAFSFRLTSSGSDPSTWRQGLPTNSTHLIVLKYDFGSSQAMMYVDPTPGAPEPASPTLSTETGDDGGSGASDVQVLLLQSSSSPGQGVFQLDTLRAGTSWADVVPVPVALALNGPLNQAVCFGSSATFNVIPTGTPPFTYQWRTNGVAVADATNSVYTLPNPASTDALNSYDVVVSDAFGSVTSQVASLIFTTNAASIVTPPVSQSLTPGVTNVTFNVVAAGDGPLSYQWRTNGTAVSGATNTSYTLSDPYLTNGPVAVDVVVSNPCGTVTSTPTVGIYYPTVFDLAYDSGPGFFGGENIILTNQSGLNLYAWSTPDLSVPVTSWNLEGPLTETPLGVTGNSRYGITLNPATSPVYYIFGETNTGPYTPTEALGWLTTADFVSFTLVTTNASIDSSGVFAFQSLPAIIVPPASQSVLQGGTASFNVTATGAGLGYQWLFNNTTISDATSSIFSLTNVSSAAGGSYSVVVADLAGSVTSTPAILTVIAPPAAKLIIPSLGTVQLSALCAPDTTYVVQCATNMLNPVWIPILTNNTGSNGIVNFQGTIIGAGSMYYRLSFP